MLGAMWTEWLAGILEGSGETVLGVVIGGALVALAGWWQSRATRSSAHRAAESAREVAELEQETARLGLKVKKDELLMDRQLLVVDEFLGLLAEWDRATQDIGSLAYPSDDFGVFDLNQRWKSERQVRQMRRVLPRPVTEAANAAVRTGLVALLRHDANFHTVVTDEELRAASEQRRIEALAEFASKREAFLDAWQGALFDE